MVHKLLLPNKWKRIGWFMMIPALLAGLFVLSTGYEADWLTFRVFAIVSEERLGEVRFFTFSKQNITQTLVGALFLIGSMLVSFAKEKREDEFISNLRLSSLLWAVWANSLLLITAFLFVYGWFFFNVMVYSLFTILILFIIRFNFILYKTSSTLPDDK